MVNIIDIDFHGFCQLSTDELIVVGVSGGTDSLALLYLLADAGYQVIAAHFDHHLRDDSGEDAKFVERITVEKGFRFVLGEADVAAVAQTQRMSVEAAARDARYRFLFRQAEEMNAQAVAVGHNADDQVETLLLHLLHGSGLSGLAGMRPRILLKQYSRRIPLVRPLLKTWRIELEEYCRLKGLTPRIDPTNVDVSYTRNRIRLEVIPYLAQFNPNIKERLYGLTVTARNSLEILEQAVDIHYQDALRSSANIFRGFDRSCMVKMSEPLRIEIVRRAVKELQPTSEDINQAALQRAVQLLQTGKNTARADLADGTTAVIDGDRFYVTLNPARIVDERFPQVRSTSPLMLDIPGDVMIDPNWMISAHWDETPTGGPDYFEEGNPFEVRISADLIKLPVEIRKKLAGDRFQPLGMKEGRMTVGDFFTNKKLPAWARANWPLLVSGGEIIWVAGVQISECVKLTSASRKIICLRLVRLNDYDQD